MLHLEEQWARDITITTGLVDASSTPTLMRLVASGQLDAARFVTHRFDMDDFEKAYEVFGDAASQRRAQGSADPQRRKRRTNERLRQGRDDTNVI